MRTYVIKKFVVLICLSAYLLAALGTSGLMVWCVGSDGHVAYESVHPNSPCAEVSADNGWLPDRLLSLISASGTTCVDQLVLAAQWDWSFDSSRSGTQISKLFPVALVSISPSTQNIHSLCSIRLVESASSSISLDARRGVILLI